MTTPHRPQRNHAPAPHVRHAKSPKWQACVRGDLPAEALPQRDREHLVTQLHTAGWSDTDIAAHTRMSTYTTARIRDRLALPPNQEHHQ